MCDREQELLIRVGALNLVLQKCLEELTVQYGVNAKTKLRAIRDELIFKFKQSGISPEQELDHAKLVRPAIEAIETAFEGFV
jgi:hypothetical protein